MIKTKTWVLGYRRVSSIDQNLARQELGDCDRIFDEKISGKSKDRPELLRLLGMLRDGDMVRVWSIDRLGRNMNDLMQIVSEIRQKGASIHFVAEKLTFGADQDDPLQTLQFHMMSAFAQFERSLIEKRRLEGVARAKAEGRYKPGREKANIDAGELLKLRADGASLRELAARYGVSVSTAHAHLVAAEGLCCANRVLAEVPLSPDRLIPRLP